MKDPGFSPATPFQKVFMSYAGQEKFFVRIIQAQFAAPHQTIVLIRV